MFSLLNYRGEEDGDEKKVVEFLRVFSLSY